MSLEREAVLALLMISIAFVGYIGVPPQENPSSEERPSISEREVQQLLEQENETVVIVHKDSETLVVAENRTYIYDGTESVRLT